MCASVEFLTFDSEPGKYKLETELGQVYKFVMPEDILAVAEMRVPNDDAVKREFANAKRVDIYGIMARVGEPAVLTIDNHSDNELCPFITGRVVAITKLD